MKKHYFNYAKLLVVAAIIISVVFTVNIGCKKRTTTLTTSTTTTTTTTKTTTTKPSTTTTKTTTTKPTTTTTTTTTTPTPSPLPTSPNERIDLEVTYGDFNVHNITVSAGTVTIVFHNEENGVLHNFAIYSNSNSYTPIFRGDSITGPGIITYTFEAPSKGIYFFCCDSHRATMTGTFVVN